MARPTTAGPVVSNAQRRAGERNDAPGPAGRAGRKASGNSGASPQTEPERVRVQKAMARAGVGSRRRCEELVAEGRVRVGDEIARPGARVAPDRDVVRVDGRRIPTAPQFVYLALNKPRGVYSTMSDQAGRPCLGDYVADRPHRLFHVGRLDADTEGLLLLTNDGEVTHRLTHPRYEVNKVYVAEVPGPVPRATVRYLRDRPELDGGVVQVEAFRVLDRVGSRALVEITLHEGRNRVVRRLLHDAGHPVHRLVRTRVGPIALGGQAPGALRELGYEEVVELYTALSL